MHQSFSDDDGSEDTLVPCPECQGEGESMFCDMCGGDQLVKAEARSAWLSAHPEANLEEQPCDRKNES